jgi:DNA-binding response OmpR family regulator
VVEDDAATARVVKGALTEAGFTVETLDKGFLLVAVVLRFQPDLLLLDINLPDMRGDTAMKMVRRAANVGDVRPLPVVILSGLPIEQLMEIQGHLGAVGCIQKPASLDTIVDRVCQILSVQRKDRPAEGLRRRARGDARSPHARRQPPSRGRAARPSITLPTAHSPAIGAASSARADSPRPSPRRPWNTHAPTASPPR